jgi:hypothetical protein
MFDTSYEEYPQREEVIKITDKTLIQIVNARQALIMTGGPYAEALEENDYFTDTITCWRVFDVSGLFDELDDGSYSMHFKEGSMEPDYIYYEN